MTSAFTWLLNGWRSWCEREERERRYEEGLQMTKVQAANAEDVGDMSVATFWSGVAKDIKRNR